MRVVCSTSRDDDKAVNQNYNKHIWNINKNDNNEWMR